LGVEQPGMDSGFLMAGYALVGCPFKLIVDMAARAVCAGMLAYKREFRLVMVKVNHTIDTIMANKAVRSKILLVLGHKNNIMGRVTIGTGVLIDAKAITGVTAGTFQRGRRIIHLMPDQAERGHRMVEVLQPGLDRIHIPSTMIGMADITRGLGS